MVFYWKFVMFLWIRTLFPLPYEFVREIFFNIYIHTLTGSDRDRKVSQEL